MKATALADYCELLPLLGQNHEDICRWMSEHYGEGGWTASEIQVRIEEDYLDFEAKVHKRTRELCRRGLIQCVGRRTCRVTGRKATVWDLPAAPPTPAKAMAWRDQRHPTTIHPNERTRELTNADS